jgi:cardiolipin synthase A/B
MLHPAWIIPAILVLSHIAGAWCAILAIATAGTPQGSVAWAVSLLVFPYVAVPLYLVFGRSSFQGYVESLRAARKEAHGQLEELTRRLHAFEAAPPQERRSALLMLQHLAWSPWLRGNTARLLVDGEATFAAIFDAIRSAREYILVQFFIIHDDRLGREMADLLIAARRRGVRVHVLYDEIGSRPRPTRWIAALREAGAQVTPFGTTRGGWFRNRFQINFRNHRKIVIADGRTGFLGGHNVGDEYMGRSPRFGHWRDTHVEVRGPIVQSLQLSFVIDWFWATRELPELEWDPLSDVGCRMSDVKAPEGPALSHPKSDIPHPTSDIPLLLIPTSPADTDNNCEMMFMEAAHAARRRLWITSPYFVPTPPVFESLRLAARRGVDVRVLIPCKPDHILVYLAAFPCITHARSAGVRIYRYKRGFLHQKVVLIDDDLAAVGTANLDNRSLRLNFELMMWCQGSAFAAEVERMLTADFKDSEEVVTEELTERSVAFAAATRVARLMDPIL